MYDVVLQFKTRRYLVTKSFTSGFAQTLQIYYSRSLGTKFNNLFFLNFCLFPIMN